MRDGGEEMKGGGGGEDGDGDGDGEEGVRGRWW